MTLEEFSKVHVLKGLTHRMILAAKNKLMMSTAQCKRVYEYLLLHYMKQSKHRNFDKFREIMSARIQREQGTTLLKYRRRLAPQDRVDLAVAHVLEPKGTSKEIDRKFAAFLKRAERVLECLCGPVSEETETVTSAEESDDMNGT